MQHGTHVADSGINTVRNLKRTLPLAVSNMEEDLKRASQAVAALKQAKDSRASPSTYEQLKSYFVSSLSYQQE